MDRRRHDTTRHDTKYVGIQAVLLNESDIYLKMTSTYTNEETEEKHVSFEAKSKQKKITLFNLIS